MVIEIKWGLITRFIILINNFNYLEIDSFIESYSRVQVEIQIELKFIILKLIWNMIDKYKILSLDIITYNIFVVFMVLRVIEFQWRCGTRFLFKWYLFYHNIYYICNYTWCNFKILTRTFITKKIIELIQLSFCNVCGHIILLFIALN